MPASSIVGDDALARIFIRAFASSEALIEKLHARAAGLRLADLVEAVQEATFERQIPNPIQKSTEELSQNLIDVKVDSTAFDTSVWKKSIEGLDYYEVEE